MAKEVKFKVSQKGAEKVSGQFGKTDKSLISMAKTALAAVGAMYALKKAMDFTTAAKNAARDATEIRSKFNAVFKDMTEKANKMADNLADSFGLAGTTARKLLGDTADLLTGFGYAQETALEFGLATNELAIDLASFTNYAGGAEGATQALVKAFTGEREAIKALGIIIREDMVLEELMTQGKDKLTGMALAQAKAEATLAIATRQSKNAIGDYARTQDELANVERRRAEAQKELLEQIGKKFVPAFTKANIVATEFFKTLAETSLETTVRQLKEMGIEAEKLSGLTYMIDLEKSVKAVAESSAKITKELSIWGNLLGGEALKSIGIILEQMPDIEGSWSSVATIQDKSLLTQKNIQNIMAGLTNEATTLVQKGDEISKKDEKRLDNLYKQHDILAGVLKVVMDRDGAEKRLVELGRKQTENADELNTELTETVQKTGRLIKDMGELPSYSATILEMVNILNRGIEPLEIIDVEETGLAFDTLAAQSQSFTDLWITEFTTANQEYINGIQSVVGQASGLFGGLSSYKQTLMRNDMRVANDEANAKIKAIQESGKSEKQKEIQISKIQESLREKEKAALKAMKPMKYAQAVSGGALAIINALQTRPFIPLGIAAGILAAGAVGVQIATIAAQEYAAGGIVSGSGTRDTVPAMLTPGEVVLNASQQVNLAGGMGGITINVSGNLIATEEEADRFAAIVQERSRLGFNQIQVNA